MMLQQAFQDMIESGMDFVFPRRCLSCQQEITGTELIPFCRKCQNQISTANHPRCQICSAVVGEHLDTSRGCVYCQKDRFHFQSVISLGQYDELLREVILRAKFGHETATFRGLAQFLCATEQLSLMSKLLDLIIPVPHHWSDRLLGQFDPPAVIASQVGASTSVDVECGVLCKVRRTPKQHSLTSVTARRANLRSAFAVRRNIDLTGQRILLVDDILTTGTTCQRAAAELGKAGAESVNVLVIARNTGLHSSRSQNHQAIPIREPSKD